MIEIRIIEAGFRIATLALVAAGVAGSAAAVDVAIALATVHAVVYLYVDHTPERLALQVRLVCLMMLVLGSVPPLGFLLEFQLIADGAALLTGYCPLSRAASLLPWNRMGPLGKALLLRTFFSAPWRDDVFARHERWVPGTGPVA